MRASLGRRRTLPLSPNLYLGPLRGRANSILPERLVREAVSEQADDPVLRRGLGWALKTSDENSCGRYMDGSSFGHTGFVGTCVWADPAARSARRSADECRLLWA